MGNKIKNPIDMFCNSKVVQSVRKGLIMIVPILIIGSFALVLKEFPLDLYKNFIKTFMWGGIYSFFNAIYNATFGFLSLYITITISYCFFQQINKKEKASFGAIASSISVYLILSGAVNGNFKTEFFGVKGMFTAIVASLLASRIYAFLCEKELFSKKVYSDGADTDFNNAFSSIFPIFGVIGIFIIADFILISLLHVTSFNALFVLITDSIFQKMGRNIFSALVFVILSSLMWFFGIHGSNVLENVVQNVFNNTNAGNEIFTKSFFDIFVLMGGCGSAICLLIALVIFSRRKNTRKLSKIAALPMIFNINELMTFGLPVVLNTTLFIPFILTPMLCTLTSYIAMKTGLVPVISNNVEWTTPVILGGYIATGSINGSLLQLLNILIGVSIYRPFIKMYDAEKSEGFSEGLEETIAFLKKAEEKGEYPTLTERKDEIGMIAKSLAADLDYAINSEKITMYYQPQYNYENELIGAEALLRWSSPQCKFVYPPLLMQLAKESNKLYEFEMKIFANVFCNLPDFTEKFGNNFHVSINISFSTLSEDKFENDLNTLFEKYSVNPTSLCIEVTEQMAFSFTEQIQNKLIRLRKKGIRIAIDDFSMGHTSIKYLQNNKFDLLKLDGNIVKDMVRNKRSADIIESIIHLSDSLGFEVIAEFVETNEQKNSLHNIGCNLYQGYLYGKAVSTEEFLIAHNSHSQV